MAGTHFQTNYFLSLVQLGSYGQERSWGPNGNHPPPYFSYIYSFSTPLSPKATFGVYDI